jgi:hypothetical protein
MSNTPNDNDIVSRLILIDQMSEEIKAIRSNVETNLKRVSEQAKQSQGAFSNLGNEIKGSFVNAVKSGIMAYAGFEVINKVTGFFKETRAEAQENMRVHAKLTTALGYTSAALNEQANILGKKLVVDDDEITAVQSMLANYVKNEEQIIKLTPAVLDLAAATGMDMVSAANMVARGIADDGAELGRFKIAVNGASGSAERVNSIILGLNKNFGDQAEKIAKTKDGWDELFVSINKFKENIGIGLFGTEEAKAKLVYENAIKYNEKYLVASDFFRKYNRDIYAEQLEIINKYEKEAATLKEEGLKKFQDKEREYAARKMNIDPSGAYSKESKKAAEDKLKKEEEEFKRASEMGQRFADEEQKRIAETNSKGAELALQQKGDEYQKKLELKEEAAVNDKAIDNQALQDKIESDSKYATIRSQMAEEEKKQREATLRGTVGNLQAMATQWHQFGGVYKAAAYAQTVADTFSGAQAAYRSLASVPYVGTVLGAAAAAVAIGAGMARAAEISKLQFEGGGIVPGSSFSGDRVNAQVNSREMILNDRQQAQLFNMANGSTISNSSTLTINYHDHSGALLDSMTTALRTDKADRFISELLSRMGN